VLIDVDVLSGSGRFPADRTRAASAQPAELETREAAPGAVLAAVEVTKAYGDRVAVDAVSLDLRAGECLGLLGPNGAGKTTTILMACGLLAPDSGTVTLGPHRLPATAPRARRLIGYVPQEIALYDDLTARENLRFFARLYGLDRRAGRERVGEMLDFVDLAGRADDRVATYSGGMKRRLNIAVALLHRPSVVLFDEPTVGVDPQSRNAILERLEQLRDDGVALLYSSHYMEEIERICTRIAIMDGGAILAEGTREQLLGRLGGESSRIRLDCSASPRDAVDEVSALRFVAGVQVQDRVLDVTAHDAPRALPLILAVLAGHDIAVDRLSVERPDLESAFLHLTGKALRDV